MSYQKSQTPSNIHIIPQGRSRTQRARYYGHRKLEGDDVVTFYGSVADSSVGWGAKFAELTAYTKELERRLAHLEIAGGVTVAPKARDLADKDGLMEIKRYFEEHDGEVVYPSDIAVALCVPYEKVTSWISILEQDGRLAKAD